MKATDYRIGNLLIDAYDRICEVEELTKDGVKAYEIHGALKPGTPKPIPLTEDWFDKLPKKHWERVGHGTRKIVQHKKFKSLKIEWAPPSVFVFYFNNEQINFKDSVHEAQNLYHSLTVEELTLTHPLP